MSNIPINELICPITMDWLEDPINLPCCGRTVSRNAMILCHESNKNCPLCRVDLTDFEPKFVAKSINMAYLVEQAKSHSLVVDNDLFKHNDCKKGEWSAIIKRLCNNNNVYQTVIGKLEIKNNKTLDFKTLVIPVIDKSGSMAGNSFKQVQYSLHRVIDMTYKCSNIMTNIITYNDMGSVIEINKLAPVESYHEMVEKLYAGGGTSFKSSFTEIVKLCKNNNNNSNITSLVVIFLTDGEDSSVYGDKRIQLVKSLKNDIESAWNKPYTIHTIGFTKSHDFNFLNNLRQIGTSEGAFRFADPSEDSDSLSNKINSVLDVIETTSSIPIKLYNLPPQIKIINGDNGKYWLNLTGYDITKDVEFEVSIDDKDKIQIKATFAEDENDIELWKEWYSHLVDEIAGDVLKLSQNPIDSLDKELHCELLHNRINSIMVRLDSTTNDYIRLEKLRDSIKILQKGGIIDKLKLNDMKFEGKFSTKTNNIVQKSIPSTNSHIVFTTQHQDIKPKLWEIIELKKQRRCNSRQSANEIFRVIGSFKNDKAIEWFQSNKKSLNLQFDEKGSNALIVASSIGRCNLVKALINTGKFDINYCNKEGYNALDLVVIYGYWDLYDILTSHGGKTSINNNKLFRTCISNRYYNMASRLLKDKLVNITDEMLENVPTNEGLEWLSERSQKEINIETAIAKGMYDIVSEKLDSITKISMQNYLDMFSKSTVEQIKTIELLLENKKMDVNEILQIKDEDNENGVTSPFFITCEKGNTTMFNMLLKYINDDSINMQNHNGTTPLWISSCNRHIDIVSALLNLGADPNKTNHKGDSPLIPACQKGNDSIVELLLEYGAKLDAYNKERDNAILICCRTGQYKILEMLFKRCSSNELEKFLTLSADIDGFEPLLASTELDKTECIKICHKYGANLETLTKDNNKILPGATALHLACFYGRLSSVKTLCDLGSNMKSQTNVDGWTPLHIAIKQGHIDVVKFLLQQKEGIECLSIEDNDGRSPRYYANLMGNKQILEEFFTNKLGNLLERILVADPKVEEKCADVLINNSRSLGCYEYNDTTEIKFEDGSTIMSHALLNGNQYLINGLSKMNADLTNKDDCGTNPLFWAKLLNYNMHGIIEDYQVDKMIENVNTSIKTNVQNKLLLGLDKSRPKFIEFPKEDINPLVKMNDGYSLKINNMVLENLNNLKSISHSLLGFIEKLKNNKIFPQGKQYLEYILYEAKIHIIKLLATGEDKLEPIHMLALYLYLSNMTILNQVNKSLQNFNTKDIWYPFIGCLYQGLNLLDNYNGEVYRAVDCKFNLQDYNIGNKLRWNSFSICSLEHKECNELITNIKKGIVFIIKSKNGKVVDRYSKYKVQKELIFLPGTEFIITNHYVANPICLAQANIRNLTFKIKDKDYEKAQNAQCCIIVEIEEI